jgi:hypothetical protein
MLQFIVTDILMISLGAILYLAVRTLPRVEENLPSEKKGVFERWIASEVPEKIDAAINSFLAKFLRKLKVLILKIDNYVSGHLQRIKTEGVNGNGDKTKSPIDFKDITEQNKNGSSVSDSENQEPPNVTG